MKLFIKVVCGKGYVIDIPEDLLVIELKLELVNAVQIPIAQQVLLSLGKVLADDKPLSYYPTIKDGSKLYLVVKKPEPMDVVITCFLRKYFTDEDSKIICKNFMKDFVQKFQNISLEELERMAISFMDEETEMGNKAENAVEDEVEDDEETEEEDKEDTEMGNELGNAVQDEEEIEVGDELGNTVEDEIEVEEETNVGNVVAGEIEVEEEN